MMRALRDIVMLSALGAGHPSGQSSAPAALPDRDRDLVQAMLQVPLVLSGLPRASTVVVDATLPICEDFRLGCVRSTMLNGIAGMPEWRGIDLAPLRDAYIDRNTAGTWRLGAIETDLALVAAAETRAMPIDVLRDRFPDGWFLEMGKRNAGEPSAREVVR